MSDYLSSTISSVEADAKKAEPIIRSLAGDLAKLSNPATDAAIVALIVKVLPGVHFNTTDVLSILGGVGIASQWIRTKVAAAAPAEPAPAPAPPEPALTGVTATKDLVSPPA